MAASRIRGKSAKRNKIKELPPPEPIANDEGERQYKLEDFDIHKTVGTGTFGRVVLVKDKKTKTYFALKVLNISEVIRLKQIEHIMSEKSILQQINHPFLIKLCWSHHDNTFLYMLLEYACGGELFTFLRDQGRFNTANALFYAAEIITSLDYLHNLDIVYRDLKPENVLLDRDGHVKITDFGFAKKLEDKTWTLCGTPEYLAPEIIQSKGHGMSVDWWALGILIFEMLVGYPPFFDDNPFGIYEKILAAKIEWPRHLDLNAKDLIKRLLVIDRTKRLGAMKNGAEDIKKHKWFKGIDWEEVTDRKLTPPIIPEVLHDGDTQNFDEYDEEDWQNAAEVSEKDVEIFKDF
ncbi:cAMP-dependent protein kinase catalytic subunit PRKX-like [Saccoglossus kowalevskii]|uniref:cAMP-dependent protein kinase catalytic subunit PRKX-like n=1 Tax=Saccoglossus kowalevskii TaxID=10224 RepID=A0ABM0N0U4_SACKO|nr:PREDICTED: cAMP-dependent protein kinase catalytic subunit PRKX-like [Saccoglossus kowalevskii]